MPAELGLSELRRSKYTAKIDAHLIPFDVHGQTLGYVQMPDHALHHRERDAGKYPRYKPVIRHILLSNAIDSIGLFTIVNKFFDGA